MTDGVTHDWAVADFDRAAATVDGLVAAVGPADWERPTPCAEWDIRRLVSHVVNGNLILTAPVSGRTAPDWDSDNLGSDPLAAFRESTAEFTAALSSPGALDQEFESILGREPGASLVRMRVSELMTHGWDLARALGRPTDLVPDLAEPVLAFWQAGLADVPRDGMPFDEAQPVPADATAADRLAAYLGRRI